MWKKIRALLLASLVSWLLGSLVEALVEVTLRRLLPDASWFFHDFVVSFAKIPFNIIWYGTFFWVLTDVDIIGGWLKLIDRHGKESF